MGRRIIFTHLLNLMDWVKSVMDISKFPLAPNGADKEDLCPEPPIKLN